MRLGMIWKPGDGLNIWNVMAVEWKEWILEYGLNYMYMKTQAIYQKVQCLGYDLKVMKFELWTKECYCVTVDTEIDI